MHHGGPRSALEQVYNNSVVFDSHFGLGLDTAAKTIEIHWPSGTLQILENVRADQILQVDELSATANDHPRN